MKKTKHDWTEADALTDADIHVAAFADPDAQPLSPERPARMRRIRRTKSLRRAAASHISDGGRLSGA
jgi:putative transcriptional regulator